MRHPEIVRIEKRHVTAASGIESRRPRGARTAVGVADKPNGKGRDLPLQFFDDCERIVCGAIV